MPLMAPNPIRIAQSWLGRWVLTLRAFAWGLLRNWSSWSRCMNNCSFALLDQRRVNGISVCNCVTKTSRKIRFPAMSFLDCTRVRVRSVLARYSVCRRPISGSWVSSHLTRLLWERQLKWTNSPMSTIAYPPILVTITARKAVIPIRRSRDRALSMKLFYCLEVSQSSDAQLSQEQNALPLLQRSIINSGVTKRCWRMP